MFGCPSDWNMPEVLDARDRRHDVDDRVGVLLVALEVGAEDLDRVLALHAARRASSTLSLMICEKLKTTPGKASVELLVQLVGQLVLRHAARPLVERLERREELDVVEAGDVGPVVGAPELRDDGQRPRGASGASSSQATFGSVGQPRRMRRIRPTYFADCSSEIDIGSVARIQKLPSSSLGMNSPPRQRKEHDAPDGR